MNNFNFKQFIQKIISFSPRQLENETKTADFIKNFLLENAINFNEHYFDIEIPLWEKGELYADDENIPCSPCGMQSGSITHKGNILSSLWSSSICQEKENINFNPQCNTISKPNHYFAPSVAVDHSGLSKILKAKKIRGRIKVRLVKHTAVNILVGNINSPSTICFAHYDSIEKGAIDNASGVAVMMATILGAPKFLKTTLFIFSACEELSYDKPIYWGKGFREFEKKYFNILNSAKKIICIDSLGHTGPQIITDLAIIKLGFPINNIERFKNKIIFLAGGLDELMSVYHSDLDNGDNMKTEHLIASTKMLNTNIV